MPNLQPVDTVVELLLARVQPVVAMESRHLDNALNCYLAETIVSPIDVPPANNSAMDGYALDSSSLKSSSSSTTDTLLEVSDRIPAGSVGKPLVPGTLARIFTGAEIPAGADTVVIQEDTERLGDKIRILAMPHPGENVRPKGQDVGAGDAILSKGARLTPESLALAASVGVSEVNVFTPLKVAIMSTGDELVEPGGKTHPGQIFNSNRYAIAGLLRNMGMEVIDLGIVRDTQVDTERSLGEAARCADCIITSGGVSVGEEDYVKAAVEKLGKIDIWKLAIKPGKPLAYGEVNGVPFFGLPGNPVSTFVTFLMVAKPYLISMQGGSSPENIAYYGQANFNFKAGSRREYIRVQTSVTSNGVVMLEKFSNQGSGIMTSVVWADALAEVEIDQVVEPGDAIKFYPLRQ